MQCSAPTYRSGRAAAAPMSARTEGSLLSAAGISALLFYFTGTAPAFLIRSEAAEEVA